MDTEPKDRSPAVPTDLLDLHVQLEDAGLTPEQFKGVTKDETSN